ncbi:MAG: DUF1365 domain-containing protein [Gammaproteobacteria bacterium]|nr:DUF1365 domain-containing protein [Gammaproteobacteria bacterium]
MTNSCIYKGRVNHCRYEPRTHSFTYSLFMMYVDLEELPTLFNNHFAWSNNTPALASFYRKDHHGNESTLLSDSIRALVKEKTDDDIVGPIRLLTHFRYFGYVFNPISLYFCFDENNKNVTHVVAEVTNTPWKERHCYVLTGYTDGDIFTTPDHHKDFHVSPFMTMDINYRWHIQIPNENLNVRIESIKDKSKLFDASINLKRLELNSSNLTKTLLNFPLMTLKVVSAIHLQAFKLWLKGIDYVPHPKNN